MRIDLNARVPDARGDGARIKPGSTPASSRVQGSGEDEARLSAHQRVQRLESQASGMPAVREEKIASLRAKIQDGSYQVSAEQVAAAMFDEAWHVSLGVLR